jgi:hypothetical protein
VLAVIVTAASVQDRDGAHPLLARLTEKFSTVRRSNSMYRCLTAAGILL